MKKTDIGKLLIVIMYFAICALPLLLFERGKNILSAGENRYLADFPSIFDEAGNLNGNIRSGIENWFDDHLGMRNKFVWLQAMVKVRVLHQSSSEKVHIGRDGWFFYTLDDNLKIADGTYPLTEDVLATLAEKQQTISNYYKAQGIDYIFVLEPSKASVYPEYIGGAHYQVDISPCDIVENYLKEHTDVHIINLKTANVDAKEEGTQFLKTDTHWTQLGGYIAYCAVVDYFNEQGILSAEPILVDFAGTTTQHGDLSDMLGANILPLETTPSAQWNARASFISTGDWLQSMENIRQQPDSPYGMVLLENDTVSDMTLLIYGDSQWLPARNIPQLLAEHFHNVVSVPMNTVPNISMDQVVQPNVVICSCSERYINLAAKYDLTVPKVVQLPDLPEKPALVTDFWIGKNGICLEMCNGEYVENADTIPLDANALQVELVGWAADFDGQMPLSGLYLQIRDQVIQCNYGIERSDVSDSFQNDNLKCTGFSVTVPMSLLQGADEIELIQIGTDAIYRYEPIIYKLQK